MAHLNDNNTSTIADNNANNISYWEVFIRKGSCFQHSDQIKHE